MKIAFDADSTEHMTCIMNFCHMDIILLPEDGLPQWVRHLWLIKGCF